MACHLYGNKLLPKPTRTSNQLVLQQQTELKFQSNICIQEFFIVDKAAEFT